MQPVLVNRYHRPLPFGSISARSYGSIRGKARGLPAQASKALVTLKPVAAQSTGHGEPDRDILQIVPCRRTVLVGAVSALLPATTAATLLEQRPAQAAAAAAAEGPLISKYEPMDALKGKDYGKPRMTYNDYTMTPSGLQFQDLKVGSGEEPQPGDTVVVDWDGYTIGYYGRPFEARNKPKGSSFSGDNKDFYRFVLGEGKVIPAFEEAVASMKPGGIRRIIVPVELGYPENDWRKLGPKPSTFAGDRALDFVLANKGMIDKTLLFDVELVRVMQRK